MWMQLGDEYYRPDGFFHHVFESREEAIDYAEHVCSVEIVEYGVHLIGGRWGE
uniref:Uncharacterized protein n=1 Tax=viral metagenome TaxID=1070528 RepID=A0A6M3IH94_9ZZZZ